MASITSVQDRSLLLLVLDLTPTTWGKRFKHRSYSDQLRQQQRKPSIGPATLSETISATLSFLLAFASCHRDNVIVIIGVAGSEVGVLYPRKDAMEDVIHGQLDEGGCRVDVSEMREGLLLGVGELVERCSVKNKQFAKEARIAKMNADATAANIGSNTEALSNMSNKRTRGTGTAIAAATSLALCLINRFMISSGASSSAASSSTDGSTNNSLLHRKEDTGILSMISSGNLGGVNSKNAIEQRMAQRRARGFLSPRIFILQASDDNTLDYNAFMNCVFCANKNDVVIDGCFLPIGVPSHGAETSTFLEQACDRTGGVYSTPKGRSQIGGGLTSVFMTLFLPTLAVRKGLNMTKVNKVDFRARCFETGVSLDIGMVCNLCLSIFKEEPSNGYCHTCGAKIIVAGGDNSNTNNNLSSALQSKSNDDASRGIKRTKYL